MYAYQSVCVCATPPLISIQYRTTNVLCHVVVASQNQSLCPSHTRGVCSHLLLWSPETYKAHSGPIRSLHSNILPYIPPIFGVWSVRLTSRMTAFARWLLFQGHLRFTLKNYLNPPHLPPSMIYLHKSHSGDTSWSVLLPPECDCLIYSHQVTLGGHISYHTRGSLDKKRSFSAVLGLDPRFHCLCRCYMVTHYPSKGFSQVKIFSCLRWGPFSGPIHPISPIFPNFTFFSNLTSHLKRHISHYPSPSFQHSNPPQSLTPALGMLNECTWNALVLHTFTYGKKHSHFEVILWPTHSHPDLHTCHRQSHSAQYTCQMLYGTSIRPCAEFWALKAAPAQKSLWNLLDPISRPTDMLGHFHAHVPHTYRMRRRRCAVLQGLNRTVARATAISKSKSQSGAIQCSSCSGSPTTCIQTSQLAINTLHTL